MWIFALGILLPLGAYCAVQCVRDFRSKDMLMWAWGFIMAAVIVAGIVQVSRNPGYRR
jgi:hypothetical protein